MSRFAQISFSPTGPVLELAERTPPGLPAADWALVAVTRSGICGSDLHVFLPTTGRTPLMRDYLSNPFEPGHEIVGVVAQAGPACPFAVGTRVAIDPLIPCVARGMEVVCDQCARGNISRCRMLTSGVLTPGCGLGMTNGLGGGWADHMLAHTSMLHPIPASLSDDIAVLHEPVSIAVHGLMRCTEAAPPGVLVIGAGMIGLATVAAAKFLHPAATVTVLAKHPHQRAAALALGADRVIEPVSDGAHIEALATLLGTRVLGTSTKHLLEEGFPLVVDAVGSGSSLTEALRCADVGATVLVLGAAGESEVDLTPIFLREVTVVGSFCHSFHDGGGHGPRHSIEIALAVLERGREGFRQVVTHRFPLEDLHGAVRTGLDRHAGAIKVVLQP